MRGPITVDREASRAAYAALHRDWPSVVAREAATSASRPDLLLAMSAMWASPPPRLR